MKVGFIGLGKMGSQMVTRLLKAGHEVAVTDLNQGAIDIVAALGAVPAENREALIAQLPTPAVVWLMIPAEYVDQELDALLAILPQGSVVVDGGNSYFRSTRARAERCKKANIELVDVGTSGGILGL